MLNDEQMNIESKWIFDNAGWSNSHAHLSLQKLNKTFDYFEIKHSIIHWHQLTHKRYDLQTAQIVLWSYMLNSHSQDEMLK